MKKLKYLISLVILALPFTTHALQEAPVELQTVAWTTADLFSFIRIGLNWFFYALLIMAVINILIVAWKYVTTSGDPDTAKKSGGSLTWILVGIIVALVAKGLIYMTCFLVVNANGKCTF